MTNWVALLEAALACTDAGEQACLLAEAARLKDLSDGPPIPSAAKCEADALFARAEELKRCGSTDQARCLDRRARRVVERNNRQLSSRVKLTGGRPLADAWNERRREAAAQALAESWANRRSPTRWRATRQRAPRRLARRRTSRATRAGPRSEDPDPASRQLGRRRRRGRSIRPAPRAGQGQAERWGRP